MLKQQLPKRVEADTIHKYQGREKDIIIFNTVCSQINEFIDNPNLINVAVSRAVNEFIVVKPKLMKLPHGTNIGDLIRYMCYTTNPAETIVKEEYVLFLIYYIRSIIKRLHHLLNHTRISKVLLQKLLYTSCYRKRSCYPIRSSHPLIW